MYVVSDLDPVYTYLPYCAHEEEIPDPNNPKEVIKEIKYYRTYPPFPWKQDGRSHAGEDPVTFINICADAGLVHWEKAEEKEARLARDGITGRERVKYSDYLKSVHHVSEDGEEETDSEAEEEENILPW